MLTLKLMMLPLVLQYYLLNLQLIAPTSLLPPLASYVPFGEQSVIRAIPIPPLKSFQSLANWTCMALTSPVLIISGYLYTESMIMENLTERFQAEVMIPSPPDWCSIFRSTIDDYFDYLERNMKTRKYNMRTWGGRVISTLFRRLGWSWQNIETGENQKSSNSGLNSYRESSTSNQDLATFPTSMDHTQRNHSHSSGQLIEQGSVDDQNMTFVRNDASSSIISDLQDERSNGDEIAIDTATPGTYSRQQSLSHRNVVPTLYRSTTLSETPGTSLVFIFKDFCASLLLLPVKAAALKHIVQTLHSCPLYSNVNGLSYVFMRPFPPFRGNLTNPLIPIRTFTTGFHVERLALLSTLQLVLELGIWTCEKVAVIWIGKKFFGWGNI